MKDKLINLSFFIIASLSVNADNTDYKNEIIQINYEKDKAPNILTGVDVAKEGNGLASQAIMGRAEFRLTSTRITDGPDKGVKHDIAQTSVAAFDTNALIKAIGPSKDAYNSPDRPIHRTQIGQGYTLSISATGLLPPGLGVSEAESSVYLERAIYPYAKGQIVKDKDASPTSLIKNNYKHEGTDYLDKTVFISVYEEFTDLTQARGEETHIAYIHPDDTVNLKTQLSETTIVVWPIGNGSFSYPQEEIHRTLPAFDISVEDLYPAAEIVFEITGGKLSEPARVPIVTNHTEVPYANSFTISSTIQDVIKNAGAGEYTINMLKISPFDTVSLDIQTLNYQPILQIRAGITSEE